nr:Trk family potassium uptake protein [Lachnospiraceae bacterium]
MSSFQVIIVSFICMIMIGTLLLMLPISSVHGKMTSFSDAMFTAVSATCVTGLVVVDTATYWSMFGQAVILMLIQIGGMGVITIGLAIISASGKKIGLWQRSTMQESISAPQVG